MHHLSHDIDNISTDTWAQYTWRGQWGNSNYQLNNFIAYQNHPAMNLNEVNGYCSVASGLVDMQSSRIELTCARMQILYVVQFKLLNTYWIALW